MVAGIPPRKSTRLVAFWSVAAGGLFTLALVLGLAMSVFSSPPPAEQGSPAVLDEALPAAQPVLTEPVAAAVPVPAAKPAEDNPRPPTPGEPPDSLPEPSAPPLGDSAPVCETQNYETSVAFLGSPAQAGKQAEREGKLVFLLHISGNFEDRQFT
jgi:hypothetical protein